MHILSSSPIVDGRPTDVDACAGCEGEQRPDRREPTSAVPRRDLVASPRRRSTPCRDRPRAASTGSRGLAGSIPVTPERDGRGGSARRGACRETGSRSIEGTPDRVQIAAGRQAPGRRRHTMGRADACYPGTGGGSSPPAVARAGPSWRRTPPAPNRNYRSGSKRDATTVSRRPGNPQVLNSRQPCHLGRAASDLADDAAQGSGAVGRRRRVPANLRSWALLATGHCRQAGRDPRVGASAGATPPWHARNRRGPDTHATCSAPWGSSVSRPDTSSPAWQARAKDATPGGLHASTQSPARATNHVQSMDALGRRRVGRRPAPCVTRSWPISSIGRCTAGSRPSSTRLRRRDARRATVPEVGTPGVAMRPTSAASGAWMPRRRRQPASRVTGGTMRSSGPAASTRRPASGARAATACTSRARCWRGR